MMFRPLAVIPARGNSERLPGKHLLPLGGKPLIAHTIVAAIESGVFDQVYLATDATEIVEVGRRFGALAPALLPPRVAAADQPSMGACTHVYKMLLEEGKGPWSHIVCLQPTSPLRSAQDIRKAVNCAREAKFEHVISVTPVDPHYHHWAMRAEGEFLVPVFGSRYNMDRAYLPEVLRPNGAIKIMRTDLVDRHETFLDSTRIGMVRMPEDRSIHVATRVDYLVARCLLEDRGEKP